MTSTTRYARDWHTMQIGDIREIRTLTCYQVQSQVHWVRKRRPECRDWRWRTRTTGDLRGPVLIVERVK
jgi:hypothetical protein